MKLTRREAIKAAAVCAGAAAATAVLPVAAAEPVAAIAGTSAAPIDYFGPQNPFRFTDPHPITGDNLVRIYERMKVHTVECRGVLYRGEDYPFGGEAES